MPYRYYDQPPQSRAQQYDGGEGYDYATQQAPKGACPPRALHIVHGPNGTTTTAYTAQATTPSGGTPAPATSPLLILLAVLITAWVLVRHARKRRDGEGGW